MILQEFVLKHLYVISTALIVVIFIVGILFRLVRVQSGQLSLLGAFESEIPAPVTSSYQAAGLMVTDPRPTIAPFTPAKATAPDHLQGLADFANSLANGTDQLVGVYAPGVFAIPVVQQPQNRADFVSTNDDEITEFSLPRKYGSTGLLAHNFLSGQYFYQLADGQEVILIYGNGKAATYRISRIERYQAITPESPVSDFIDLSDPTQTHLNSSQLFHRIYGKSNEAIFQTCIDAYGDPSWGRMFVIANQVSAIQPIPQITTPSLN